MHDLPPDLDPRIDLKKLPKHIGVIMDGNRRWAELRGKTTSEGHEAGTEGVKELIKGCKELCIQCVSLYAFSTENWTRPKEEVNALFSLITKYVRREIDELIKNNIRVMIMGEWQALPPKAVEDLKFAIEETKNNTGMTVVVGLNYGGRYEIVRSAKILAEKVQKNEIKPDDINEKLFAQHLYVPEYPELDLLIRTSGEQRISNFMLWQISYAELVFLQVLWPDFKRKHLWEAIIEYQRRQRRFGGRLSDPQ